MAIANYSPNSMAKYNESLFPLTAYVQCALPEVSEYHGHSDTTLMRTQVSTQASISVKAEKTADHTLAYKITA